MAKQTFDIYKLDFGDSPLHLSRGKLNTYADSEAILHSDALKSAIFVTGLELYGEGWAQTFHDFHVSSAMPYKGEQYFFPKPLHIDTTVEQSQRKEIKGYKYIEQSVFQNILRGSFQATQLNKDTGIKDFFRKTQTQRVQIKYAFEDREEQGEKVDYDNLKDLDLNYNSVPFYIEKNYIAQGSGLFFIINTIDKEKELFLKTLDGIMRLLGENGIGLQRGLGNGHFTVQRTILTLDTPDVSTHHINLSLYCPADETELKGLTLTDSYYQLIKRGGWISSPISTYRKRTVYMFTEGSVFKTPVSPIGKVADLKPKVFDDHAIWRDGKSIFLPMA